MQKFSHWSHGGEQIPLKFIEVLINTKSHYEALKIGKTIHEIPEYDSKIQKTTFLTFSGVFGKLKKFERIPLPPVAR